MQSNTEEGNAPTPLRTSLRRHRARTSPYSMDRSTPQERSPSQDREQRSTSEEDRPEAGQAARPAATTPHPGTLQTNQASTGAQPILAGPDDIFELIACILARETDRAGATAESSLREVVEALQQKWGGTFQASATVWRMWANRITRNLDRSTWAAEIANLPPSNIVHLLDPAESRLEAHLTDVAQSSNVALDCVRASIEDCHQLRGYLDAARRFFG
ncbi:hypothetical protein F441_04167 [Phytophthora nicotianae CJ01A1]|uniref:Uncharacterized protein n=1 Tax=Phytophthora nicotianae CJ01A1 TaxID=1317063 RepID=W2XJ81_PHYNI|nr:hypothetical protein F441_04167 [Phytophthora nicotianae CJ01A1]